jgi:hypothetical protein
MTSLSPSSSASSSSSSSLPWTVYRRETTLVEPRVSYDVFEYWFLSRPCVLTVYRLRRDRRSSCGAEETWTGRRRYSLQHRRSCRITSYASSTYRRYGGAGCTSTGRRYCQVVCVCHSSHSRMCIAVSFFSKQNSITSTSRSSQSCRKKTWINKC